MTAEAAALVRRFRVGPRTVTMTIPKPQPGQAVCMAVEWSPDIPLWLSRRELAEYRAGRDAAIAALTHHFNTRALVVEL
jgi:hypothetical protein